MKWKTCGLVWHEFCEKGLNEPGTLVEIKDSGTYLIGDVNTNRGVCDDCTAFNRDAIVKRYKVVVEKDW